ncbi:undecaprenyl diphosphate synthase family protein [Salmonella enterica subsp. enterica serovar Weltevreden]|nr:undecaprenyl diphosphate synthase family protein [Salmonella enterica subsp. enterica serovar Weltevreden]
MAAVKCVAIIMDGNGRWAKKAKIRLLGIKPVRSPSGERLFAANNGIDALTLYAFSSETEPTGAGSERVNGAVCVGAG